MYCIDTEALVFMFKVCYHISPTLVFNGLDGLTVVYTNHIIMKSTCIMAVWHPRPIYAVHP